jgi:cell division protein FtsB
MIAYNLTSYDLPKPKRSYVRIFVISFLVLFSVYFFYFLLFGERGYVHYYKLKNQNEILSNKIFDLREKNQIEREKLEKFDFEENDKIFYIIPKFKEGIENLDNNNCFLWYDGTKFCMFK